MGAQERLLRNLLRLGTAAEHPQPDSEHAMLIRHHQILERLRGTATDGVGPIARIEASVTGSEQWVPFFPRDGVFDEPREEFDAELSALRNRLPDTATQPGQQVVSARIGLTHD